jgi:hypothetical protein
VEAFATAVVLSPPIFIFGFMDGVFLSRYPRTAFVGAPPPPPPATFPSLVAAGLRYGLSVTGRTLLWAGTAHGLGSALREAAGTGLRHEARPADNPAYYVSGFAGGATMAAALTSDWAYSMGRVRWGGYVVLGGFIGSALPDILLRVGPAVRSKVESLR